MLPYKIFEEFIVLRSFPASLKFFAFVYLPLFTILEEYWIEKWDVS